MLNENFWLDGENAKDRGIFMQREFTFSQPEPITEIIQIPGGINGDIFFEDGSYKNVTGMAKCFAIAPENVSFDIASINIWLMGKRGYRKLQVKSDPFFYRLARVSHGARLEPRLNRLNPFEITFDCQPFKYYIDGEAPIEVESGETLQSPSEFVSYPEILIHGSGNGSLTVGENTMIFADCDELLLDCAKQNATKDGLNANEIVGGSWLNLSGNSQITFGGGISGISVKPHWRTL